MRAFAAALALALLPAEPGLAVDPAKDAVAVLIDSARMWESKNRADLARVALEKALLLDPANPKALLELGIIEIKSNQLKRASELLQQARTAHPHDPATRALDDAYRIATKDRLAMATARFLSGSPDKREEAVKALRNLFPNGPPGGELGIEYYRILAATEKGRAEAKAGLERMIAESPRDPRPQLELADFFIDKPETRLKGLGIVTKLARRDDTHREEVFKVWRRGLKKLDIDPAHEALFRDYLASNPDDEEIRQKFARVSDPVLKARRSASARLDAGQLELAERQYREILKAHPDDIESLEAMGEIRMAQERYDEARGYFDRVAKLAPAKAGKWDRQMRTARYWHLLKGAKAAQDRGQMDQAERDVRAAAELDPHDVEAPLTLAGIYLDRRDLPRAEGYFQQVLRLEPGNERAQRGLIKLYSLGGNRQAAMDAIAAFVKAHPKKTEAVAHERASLFRDEADTLLQRGQIRAAMAVLEKGVEAVPTDPWLRYDLARVYQRLGFTQTGRELMARSPPPGEEAPGYYAQSLFLAGIDDEQGALDALAKIPPGLRNESTAKLARQTSFRLEKRRVREALSKGQRSDALRFLQQAEAKAKADPELQWELAELWVELGDSDRALALWQEVMRTQSPDPPLESQLRYADLLNDAKKDRELAEQLDRLRQVKGLTEDQSRRLQSIRHSHVIRQAEVLRAEGKNTEAVALLEWALKERPDERRLLRAFGEYYTETGEYAKAETYYDRILAIRPLDFDAHLSKIKLARLNANEEDARRRLAALQNSVPPDDIDTRLGIVRQLIALGDIDDARRELEPIHRKYPEDAKILLQEARLEREASHYEQALALFRQAQSIEDRARLSTAPSPEAVPLRYLSPTAREIQEIEGRRYGYVSAGFDYRELSGTKGISGVTNQEYPMLFRYPIGYEGHIFAQVDYATVSAGNLQLGNFDDAQLFGKIDALGSPKLFGPVNQAAAGAAFGLGYQNDAWRFDVGSSPQGYPVSYPVGGIRHSGSWHGAYYSWDIARRPVANSKLSYAGAADPITGEVWGGVRADGGEIYVGYDYGRLGLFIQGAAHYFSGKNVRTNNDVMFRGGADWNFIKEPDMRLNAGFALMYWSYAENQRFYTFGYGGYFSPQAYKSISLPVQWTGRFGDLSYLFRAYGAYSHSSDDGGVYYPTNQDLQAIAEQRAGTVVDGFTFPQPFHEGSRGGAVSYGVRGALEYQVDPQWFVGGLLELQRSPFYTPNYMTFYFRYAFEPRVEAIPYPPAPLRPYYRY